MTPLEMLKKIIAQVETSTDVAFIKMNPLQMVVHSNSDLMDEARQVVKDADDCT